MSERAVLMTLMSSISIATAMHATAIVAGLEGDVGRLSMAPSCAPGRSPPIPRRGGLRHPRRWGMEATQVRQYPRCMAGRPLGAQAAAVRETIAELCEAPPDAPELVEEVANRVRRVVPFDGGAWMINDPESMLPTSISKESDADPALHRAFVQAELLEGEDDINSFVEMARTGQTAAGLALTTGGDMTVSKRYRDIHLPYGIHDELRVLGRSAGEVWAMGCVSRGDDLPEFTEDEVRWVASIASHLGQGVRTALSRSPQVPLELRTPGMLVLADDGTVEAS